MLCHSIQKRSRFLQPENLNDSNSIKFNGQRNRAATLRFDFRFRRIRRSDSRNCYAFASHIIQANTYFRSSPAAFMRFIISAR
jgi:hypothetical protein